MVTISPIVAFQDNYIWVLSDQKHLVIVDPGDAKPVLTYLTDHPEQTVCAILLTHHHHDHADGIEILKHHQKNVRVYASYRSTAPGITHTVVHGDCIRLPSIDLDICAIETPGHTLDHVCFFEPNSQSLFSGDTLFSGGCGRVFEGTSEMMVESLSRLSELPDNTCIYPGHEYTQGNVDFARLIEPDSLALQERQQEVIALRQRNEPTVPVSLSTEKLTNPFLRLEEKTVIEAASQHARKSLTDRVSVFTALREWKNMR